jgi:hypothetical protein
MFGYELCRDEIPNSSSLTDVIAQARANAEPDKSGNGINGLTVTMSGTLEGERYSAESLVAHANDPNAIFRDGATAAAVIVGGGVIIYVGASAAVVAAVAFVLEATDKAMVVYDTGKIAAAGVSCKQGDQAACRQAAELATQYAKDTAMEWSVGWGIAGSFVLMKAIRNLPHGTLPNTPNVPALPKEPKVTIHQHYAHHADMVADVKSQLKAQGFDVSDKEMSFGSSCGVGRCRPDIVYRDSNGKIGIIEIKTGDADYTIRQTEIFPQINSGDAIPRGKVAEDFGLDPGVPLRDQEYPNGIPIQTMRFPGAKP